MTRSFGSMALFGVSYALASLGCTIGPFLVTVVATLRTSSIAGGVTVFAAYAVGMGVVVALVSLAVALARTTVLTVLRRSGGLVSRAGGLLLVLSGGYVAYYGWYELRVLSGAATDDPVIAVGSAVQRWLAGAVEQLGVAGALIGLVALAAALVVLGMRRARRNRKVPVSVEEAVPRR